MIRYLPELAPLPRESRELVRLLIQSMSFGAPMLAMIQKSPVTRVVRTPRYAQFGLVTAGRTWIQTSLSGRRVLTGKRDDHTPLVEKAKNAADGAITAFETITVQLRYVASELRQIRTALEAVPEATLESWQADVLEELRALLPTLEKTAFEACDAARMKVPGDP